VTRWAPEGVYALDEWRWVGLYDPATLELLKHWDVGPVSDLLPDETGGFFLTTLSGRLEHHRADGTTQTAPLHRLGLFHLMALDAAGGRLFVGNMAATRLQVFDARTLAMQREVEVGRGARSLLWRGAFGTLLVGEYFSGWLVAYDSDLKEIGRVYAGRRLRSIQPLRSDSVLTASAAGALAINLPTVFPGLEMRQPPDDAAAPGDPPPSAPPAAACSAP
jgi:hypothetical protein